MSYSSFYGIRKDFTGECLDKFDNSWLFSPIIWNVLSDKLLPRKYGMIQSIIGLGGTDVWKTINRKMNESDCTADRVCWELSNQLIFFTKNKTVIANAIRDFLKINDMYDISDEDGIYVLKREHIIERFNEIANTIKDLDEEEYPYFVFKNTSVDDGVQRWFEEWDEETDDLKNVSLKDCKECVTEFVIIKNGIIKEFIPNNEYNYD